MKSTHLIQLKNLSIDSIDNFIEEFLTEKIINNFCTYKSGNNSFIKTKNLIFYINDSNYKYILTYEKEKQIIKFSTENLKAAAEKEVYTLKDIEKFLHQVKNIMEFVYFA